MENTRETKIVTTPVGKQKVVLHTYVTGREKRQLRDIYLDTTTTDGQKFNAAQDTAWNIIIVSIDGNTENIVDTILNMHNEDTAFLTDTVNEVTTEQKKTN